MPKITPFLWFDTQAEEALDFYTAVFANSKIVDVTRFEGQGPAEGSTVISGTLEIEGQEFMVLNGGPMYKFTPAISFFVSCQDQDEIDRLWNSLLEGGEPMRCGWLTDKFGVTWQIVPSRLGELLQNPDPEKSRRVLSAMMEMVKLDISALERARDEE